MLSHANSGYEIARLRTVDVIIGFLRPTASEIQPDANAPAQYRLIF